MSSDGLVSARLLKLGDEFDLDLGAYELRRGSQALRLGRIPMELLLLLIEQRGQLVTRERIIERVWGKDVFLDTDNSINAAIRKIRQILEDDSDQPRFVQTVIGRGYRFIASIEEGDSSASMPSAAEAIASKAPTGKTETESAESQPSDEEHNKESAGLSVGLGLANAKPSRLAYWIGSGVLFALFLFAGILMVTMRDRLPRSGPSLDPVTSTKSRPSVAVLGFKNLSGKDEEAWISTAFSEMLAADLASGQQLRLIAGENVARMKVDLALPAADSYSAETLTKIRKHLSNDMVVLGSYLALGDNTGGKVRVNLQLQDARGGETIAVVSEDGNEADLAELVSRSGDRVRQILKIGSVSALAADQVRAALPENTEASRFYAEGLLKLRNFDALTARDFFLQAVAADPKHALSHAALSECWASLGYDFKAQEEAKKAMALASQLSREDQLSIEGRYRQTAHDGQGAMEIYRMLSGFFPDNLDYGLALARAQASAGHGKEAMDTVKTLANRPLPDSNDARIDIAEAVVADKLGDLRREELAAARAIEKGRRQGQRVLTANALLIRGSALGALGDTANGVPVLNEAKLIFIEVGDRQGVARVFNNLGILARHQSHLLEAQRLQEESLKIFRETGSKLGMLQSLNNLGNVLWDRGEMAATLEAHQQSLQLSREIGDKFHESTSLNNIGGLQTLQGKLGEARQTYDESLRLSREMGDQEGVGTVLGNTADLLTRQGDLATARKLAEEALTTDRQVGNKSFEAYALHQLATVLVSQGDTTSGRSRYQDAIAIRHELGETATQAESELGLAELLLDTGDAKGAELKARSAAAIFHEGSAFDNEALSYSTLALALLAEGKAAESRQAAERSIELLPKTMDLATRLQVDVAKAYVVGMHNAGALAPADRSTAEGAALALEAARDKSNRLRYVGLELEARLRLGELELQSGKSSAGRAHLEQMQQEASAKGFFLIARMASDALRTNSSRR